MPVGQLSDGSNLALYLIGKPRCEETLLRYMYVEMPPSMFDRSPTDRPQVGCRGRLAPSASTQADVRRKECGINHIWSVRSRTPWTLHRMAMQHCGGKLTMRTHHASLSAVLYAYFL
jgi:hypothetical protein